MATSIVRTDVKEAGGLHVYTTEAQLLTSGTTVTVVACPVGKRIYGCSFYNVTQSNVTTTAMTVTEATATVVSPTMTVNDICRISVWTD